MKKEDFPALECPSCNKATPPRSVNQDDSVTYTCVGKNHEATHGQPETWRIAEDGTFLQRTESRRYERT
ncbi:hypothetical protein F6X40_09820 [Paraburkholderia sp. UCT31]|uniref:hypothetical protein n=1 Tax=Paraburkholderia sp. UCT31 TaxID=2615209 RepID=UPI00165570F9|nr:hypothetical protein [Paraburkholderia sp. UCT31]MBC8737105.1 hypothetical protein [Paraburkholderia sp. UCT31]